MFALSTPNAMFTITGIGPVLELIRRTSGRSISSVARQAGIENDTVKRIESGHGSLRSVNNACRALDTNVSVILISSYGKETRSLNEIGDFIKKTRMSQKLSQHKLAKRIGRSAILVKGVEASVNPTIASIDLVLKALNISTELQFTLNGEYFIPPVAPGDHTTTHVLSENELLSNLGETFKNARIERNLSKLAVAYHASLSMATIDSVESGRGSLHSINDSAAAMGYRLVILLLDEKGRLTEITDALTLPLTLNFIRESRGISVAGMARKMNSTFASVKAFSNPDYIPQMNTIERFATALDLTIGFRLDDTLERTSTM